MKIFKNPTFRTSLIFLIIIFIIISTTFFFVLYNTFSDTPLEDILIDDLNKLSVNNAEFIDYWLDQNVYLIQSLAQTPSASCGESKEVIETIKSYSKIHKNFYEIGYTDNNGDTKFSSAGNNQVNISDRSYFIAAKNGVSSMSDIIISRTTNKPVIIICSPILKDNVFNGVIIGVIEVNEISKLTASKSFRNINQSYIFIKDGNLLSPLSKISNNSIYSQNINKLKASGEKNKLFKYTNDQGKNVLGSYTILSHNGWISVNEIDISENIKAVRQNSIIAGIFTLLLITILLIPLILYITRKLTHPLRSIAQMASELSIGKFENRIDYKSNNEIGLLAKSFNKMADRLQLNYIELNNKIIDLNEQKEEMNLKNIEFEKVIDVNKSILEQLEENNKKLELANKVKAEFLTTMTHELRTPMNSIIGYTEMILDGNDGEINEEQRKDLEIILRSAENLLSLINDVLDLSKSEAGKMNYKYKYFNIIDEISLLIKNINVMSQNKGLEIIFEHDDNVNEIYSDPVKIHQIVSNLLSNAVKFTDHGSIKVSISKKDYGFINISVSDTGIGIPEDELDNIFHEFKQLDSSSTRKYGGTGLGLSIVKALTEGLGGTISVTSKLGEGSTFSIRIPIVNE